MFLQHDLPQAIAIPSRTRVMIRSAVALDSKQISPRSVGIRNREVDKESCDADLRMNLVTPFYQRVRNLNFKYTIVVAA